MPTALRPRHAWLLGSLAAGTAIALAFQPAIRQDQAYHQFADTRPALGIPHAWNVLSNAPFLLIGLLGLHRCRRCAGASPAAACLALTRVPIAARSSP